MSSGKAAASEGPEAYPLGYVEGLNDARTKLAAFFSILLEETSAVPLIDAKPRLADLLVGLCRPLAGRWRPIRHGETAIRTIL